MAEKVMTENEKMTEKVTEKKNDAPIGSSAEVLTKIDPFAYRRNREEEDGDNAVDVSQQGAEKVYTIPSVDVYCDINEKDGTRYHNIAFACGFKTSKVNPDGSPKIMEILVNLIPLERRARRLYDLLDLIFDGKDTVPLSIVRTVRYNSRLEQDVVSYTPRVACEDEQLGEVYLTLRPANAADTAMFNQFITVAKKRGWID